MNEFNEVESLECPDCNQILVLDTFWSGGADSFKNNSEYCENDIQLYNCTHCSKLFDSIEISRILEMQNRKKKIELI